MKSWIILIVVAVAIMASVTVAVPFLSTDSSSSLRGPEFPSPPKPDGPAPKLVIDEDLTYNFKVLPRETKGTHQWTFKNSGPGELEVRGSSTTCSCTTSDLFEGVDMKVGKLIKIGPGESKLIAVNWDTKKFENHYRQFVTVATNDPERPTIELVIEGEIKYPIVTLPPDPSVSFMNVSNDEPVLRRIVMSSPDRPETKITQVISSNAALLGVETHDLSAEELKKTKFDKAFWIDVTLKPSPNLGEFNEAVVVETDHPLRQTITIKVTGRVTGPISIFPEKVTMTDASSSNGGSQTLKIWARSRSSVNFTVAKKPVGMEVAIEPLPTSTDIKGSRYNMTVKLAPGLESGLIEDEILLKTDDPKASEIHVPVTVLIKGAR